MDMRHVQFSCVSAEELWGGTGTERGSAGGNDEMGGKEECNAEARAVALRSSQPRRPQSQTHVLNLTKQQFAVRSVACRPRAPLKRNASIT